MMAQSRCSFSTLIRYGSLKVGSTRINLNAFLDCQCLSSNTGMIGAEELSFREWKCFEHLAHQREGNRISSPKLDRASSGNKQREENRRLEPHLRLFD